MYTSPILPRTTSLAPPQPTYLARLEPSPIPHETSSLAPIDSPSHIPPKSTSPALENTIIIYNGAKEYKGSLNKHQKIINTTHLQTSLKYSHSLTST